MRGKDGGRPGRQRLPAGDWVHGTSRQSVGAAGSVSRGRAVPQQTFRPSAPSNRAMTSIPADLRLALRGLRRSPLFAIVAILSLALGIGANTAIFTLIDQILLRKLPVRAPDELVMLYQQRRPQRQQHGRADALVSDLPGSPAEGRAARRGAVPPARAGLGQRRQPDRAGRRGDGVRQLLLHAGRDSRRSAASSTRRRTIRSTGAIRSSCSATTTGSAASPAIPRSSARRSG